MADGIARSGWDIDLLDGKAREDAFAHVLCQARVEVKSDHKCRETGRLFVEIRQRGKADGKWRLSGLAVTQADWWAFEVHDDRWLVVPTWQLKAIAKRVWERDPKAVRRGGDFNGYEGVLVPLQALVGSDLPEDDESAWPVDPGADDAEAWP